MRDDERVILRIPVTELWDARGPVPGARGSSLSAEEIRALLRAGPVRFAVAEPGTAPKWVEGKEVFEFWKREVLPHLVAPEADEVGFYLEDFPGEYAYVASRWLSAARHPVVLLERHH